MPGIQVNLVSEYGWSALMLASGEGHEGIVQLLLDMPGIQVNLVNKVGSSALTLASIDGYEEIVKLLQERSQEQGL